MKKVHSRDKFDLNFSDIHGLITPGDIRSNDRVQAKIRARNARDDEYQDVRVWKLSPFGIELKKGKTQLNRGDQIDLEILIAGQRIKYEGLVVDLHRANDEIELIGIRFAKSEMIVHDHERRNQPRWHCSPDYFPTATCPTPARINDNIFFKIKDISANGMLLTCSLRNKIPIPGIILHVTANFGVDGNFHTPVKVKHVNFTSEAGKDRLAVGVEFLKLTERMKSIMAQYLIQFSNVYSVDELRNQGFWPQSVTDAVNFQFLTTESEYREVLVLRRLAHESDNNLVDEVSDDDMGDMIDAQSRIVIGKFNDKIVCTVRLRFNIADEPLEHEQFVQWPEHLPSREQIMEIGRLAIDPAFRHTDLLSGLFEFASATSIRDREFAVISCLERMVPFFKKIGYSDTGLRYDGYLFNEAGFVMMANVRQTMLGGACNPMYWNLVWRKAAEFLIESEALIPSPLETIRLRYARLFGPIARVFFTIRQAGLKRKASARMTN